MNAAHHQALLLDAACEPYRNADRFAYYFARGKLRVDPVYRYLLTSGLLRGRSRILDLGCGQGLLGSWLKAAACCYAQGRWPATWPAAPAALSTRGLELKAREIERARSAAGAYAQLQQADIREAAFGCADAIVLFDVLHYMDAQAQLDILKKVRAALPRNGLLLLRIGDARGGLRFHYGRLSDALILLLKGHRLIRQHCRSVAEWRGLLADCGFDCEAQPMSAGTPFANVLLIAHAR